MAAGVCQGSGSVSLQWDCVMIVEVCNGSRSMVYVSNIYMQVTSESLLISV